MLWPTDILRVVTIGVLLLGSICGAVLYLRAFWLYFRLVRWIHDPAHVTQRRRYKSSAIAAAMKEPELAEFRHGLLWGLVGLPLFAVAGMAYNAMIR